MNFSFNLLIGFVLLAGFSAGTRSLVTHRPEIDEGKWWLEERTDSTLPVEAKGNFVFPTGFLFDTPSETVVSLATSPRKAVIGLTKKGLPIDAYYFPGISNKRALVIGGMHGSELSSIAVAQTLLQQLQEGKRPFYTLILIPCLFPDNAQLALSQPQLIGGKENIGRYTHKDAVDPNRQMPSLGQPFNKENKHDHLGRTIEKENRLLLQLIHDFLPERIVNLHGIRTTALAGIYADPRTDGKGRALGYESDSLLALSMARYVRELGGTVSGNRLDSVPTARYPKDPVVVPAPEVQPRTACGSVLPNNRGCGVSLGSWATTAIEEAGDPYYNRPAISLITVEFPGYKRPEDYRNAVDREWCKKEVQSYAAAIMNVFLQGS